MKRIAIILCAIISLSVITILIINPFVLGVPWVKSGTTSAVDADQLLGKYYVPIHMTSSSPQTGRDYLVHVSSFIIWQYEIEFGAKSYDDSDAKWICERAVWRTTMKWDENGILEAINRTAKLN